MRKTLQDKLDVLQKFDDEVLDLIENEDELEGEIEQSDTFRERIHLALINIDTNLSEFSRQPDRPQPLEESSSHAISPRSTVLIRM